MLFFPGQEAVAAKIIRPAPVPDHFNLQKICHMAAVLSASDGDTTPWPRYAFRTSAIIRLAGRSIASESRSWWTLLSCAPQYLYVDAARDKERRLHVRNVKSGTQVLDVLFLFRRKRRVYVCIIVPTGSKKPVGIGKPPTLPPLHSCHSMLTSNHVPQ